VPAPDARHRPADGGLDQEIGVSSVLEVMPTV
jgi:hypothetical protein